MGAVNRSSRVFLSFSPAVESITTAILPIIEPITTTQEIAQHLVLAHGVLPPVGEGFKHPFRNPLLGKPFYHYLPFVL